MTSSPAGFLPGYPNGGNLGASATLRAHFLSQPLKKLQAYVSNRSKRRDVLPRQTAGPVLCIFPAPPSKFNNAAHGLVPSSLGCAGETKGQSFHVSGKTFHDRSNRET